MMVALKTAGAMDGAQVERRVVPLEPRAVPPACARGEAGSACWHRPYLHYQYQRASKTSRTSARFRPGVPPRRRRRAAWAPPTTVEAGDGGGGERAMPAASDNG